MSHSNPEQLFAGSIWEFAPFRRTEPKHKILALSSDALHAPMTLSSEDPERPDHIYHGTYGEDTISGSVYDDTIYGYDAYDSLHGNYGDDYIDGGGGNDYIYGDFGNDLLDGGDGADNVSGGTGNDTLHGGAGRDELWGEDGNDVLYADGCVGTLYGGDKLFGGEGDDRLVSRTDTQELSGGTGTDWADYTEIGTDIFVKLSAGRAYFNSDGTQKQFMTDIENVIGGWGNDTIYGNASANTLLGHFGNDTIYGGEGGDHLVGGEGDDRLVVTAGFAHLTGWNGNDKFQVNPNTTGIIWDFGTGDDQVLISNTVLGSYAELLAYMSQSGSDVIVAKGGFQMIFKNTALSSLQADDFMFI